MAQQLMNYIVAPSRLGWTVSANSDRLSEHRELAAALEKARWLVTVAADAGLMARVVDLSSDTVEIADAEALAHVQAPHL